MRPPARSPLRIALAAAVVAAASLTFLGPAGAGAGFAITVSPSGNSHQVVFDFDIPGDECVSDTVVTVPGVPDAIVDLADANSGTVTLPVGTPGNFYDLEIECSDGRTTISSVGGFAFASVNVDKVVTGEVPADAQFAISVACENRVGGARQSFTGSSEGLDAALQADLTYGASGGSEYLVSYEAASCTVSETDDGGAVTSSITVEDCGSDVSTLQAPEAAGPSGDFIIPEPTDCTQTVTNEFAPPAAQPADVVQQQPGFTG